MIPRLIMEVTLFMGVRCAKGERREREGKRERERGRERGREKEREREREEVH